MNKVITYATIVFSLLTFGLMAEESTNNNTAEIKRNSLSIDFGKTFATLKDEKSGEKLPDELNPKLNVNLTYLRKLDMLDNRFSLGFDLQTHISDEYKDSDSREFDDGSFKKAEVKTSVTTPLVFNILADYEVLSLSKFTTSLQVGVGFALHSFDKNYEEQWKTVWNTGTSQGASTGSSSGSITSTTTTPALKVGVTAYYNIIDSLAIGAKVHYMYTGTTNFDFDDDTLGIKNSGFVTTNISLKYMF